jgi:hypothetical protein
MLRQKNRVANLSRPIKNVCDTANGTELQSQGIRDSAAPLLFHFARKLSGLTDILALFVNAAVDGSLLAHIILMLDRLGNGTHESLMSLR